MRFVVCTVGGSPAPIISTLRQFKNDYFYFIGSDGDDPNSASVLTIEKKYEQTQKVNCPKCGEQKIRKSCEGIVSLANFKGKYSIYAVEPDSIESNWSICEKIKADIKEKCCSDDNFEVIADYSGGTKTMTSVLVAFALQQTPHWELMMQAAGQRTNLQGIDGGNLGIRQSITEVIRRQMIARSRELMAAHNYQKALAPLEVFISKSPLQTEERKELFEIINECKMMAAWNSFDHETALTFADSATSLKAQYSEQLKTLVSAKKLFQNNECWRRQNKTPYLLVQDLVRNANQCAENCKYDDAVGRLYRATELLSQIHLRRCFDIRTSNVDISKIREENAELRVRLEKFRTYDQNGLIKIGLRAGYDILRDLGDDLGRFFGEKIKDMQNFLDMRNKSLFAHGIIPVGRNIWDKSGKQWVDWIKEGIEIAKKVD